MHHRLRRLDSEIQGDHTVENSLQIILDKGQNFWVRVKARALILLFNVVFVQFFISISKYSKFGE